MSPRAGDAQQAAYVPSANRASCPVEVTILRAAGSRHSASCPTCVAQVVKRRRGAGGKKARARQGQPLGGRAEGGPLLALDRAAGRRKWEGGYLHLSTTPRLGHRGPPSRPHGGAPLRAQEVGGGRRKRCAHWSEAVGRRGSGEAGRGKRGLSEPSRTNPAPRPGKGRKCLTSDTTLSLVPQCDPRPLRQGGGWCPRRSRNLPASGSFQSLGGGVEPLRHGSPVPRATAGGAHLGQGLGPRPEREVRASPSPEESAPQKQAKKLLNQVSHLCPHPSEEPFILAMCALGAQPPHVPRRAHY